MRHDVIVIGAGLSGLMAAKTAIESGLKTMVLGKGMGMMHIFPGGIDLLGYHPENDMAVQEEVRSGLSRLIQDKPNHPYARVGLEDIERAVHSFSGLFDPEGYHYTGEPGRNTILPTGIGSLRPSYLVPSTMIAGRDIFSEPTLVVGFHEFSGFYPAYAVSNFRSLSKANGLRVRSGMCPSFGYHGEKHVQGGLSCRPV